MRTVRKKGSKAVAKPLPIEVTQKEYIELLANTKYMRHKVAFVLACESGLRISEVVGLKPEDIHLELNQLRVNMGKNSKDRIVKLPSSWKTNPHLKNYLPIECKQRALQKAFIQAAEKSGLKNKKPKVHFHSLRHGFATECIRSTVAINTVSKMLGHEDLSTTQIYVNLCPDEMIQEMENKFGRRIHN